jgi:ribonuclease HII
MLDYSFEEKCQQEVIVGIDEVGRGPLAGPLIAAATILDSKKIPCGINDSKQIPRHQREKIFDQLMQNAICAVGIVSVGELNNMNLNKALEMAIQRAISSLSIKPTLALIDGNLTFDLPCKMIPIVKGDQQIVSIAAASIIAKVTRDRVMRELDQYYPHYLWKQNVGYGTEAHIEAIYKYGITDHHRLKFAPIRRMLEKENR